MSMVAVGKLGSDFYREFRFAIAQCQPSADPSFRAFCQVLGVNPDWLSAMRSLRQAWATVSPGSTTSVGNSDVPRRGSTLVILMLISPAILPLTSRESFFGVEEN